MAGRVQTVTFLRHGVAQHNLRDPVTNQPPRLDDPNLIDPPLLWEGKYQAVQAGEELQSMLEIDLIICSPLTRCLQTACIGFSPQYNRPPVPIVCKEDVREAFGKHYPDQRRDKTLLQKYWPTVQFESTMTEFDIHWNPSRRETYADVRVRVQNFLQWLCTIKYSNIVVVSHGVFIECLLQTHAPYSLQPNSRVYNTDAFTVEVLSRNGEFLGIRNVRQIRGSKQG